MNPMLLIGGAAVLGGIAVMLKKNQGATVMVTPAPQVVQGPTGPAVVQPPPQLMGVSNQPQPGSTPVQVVEQNSGQPLGVIHVTPPSGSVPGVLGGGVVVPDGAGGLTVQPQPGDLGTSGFGSTIDDLINQQVNASTSGNATARVNRATRQVVSGGLGWWR
jgi:hypothetical protein